MQMSSKMKSDQKEAISLLTITDIDNLLQTTVIDPNEISCFVNVEVPLNGVPTILTLKITEEGESINPTVLNLPDGLGAGIPDPASVTQPTRGFHKQKITKSVFKEVYEELKNKFEEYVFLLQKPFFSVLSLASMSSYFREAFYTFPFIDFHANDLECGKTTAMKAFSWSAYNGVIQTIPTPAVIYRKIQHSKGVLGLDELEDTLRNRESAGFIKGILDAAHTKGIPAERCDPNDANKIQTFDAFGIKVFSRVGGIPNSIISRSIRIPMIQAPKSTKLKKLRSAKTFEQQRNKMYLARIRYSSEVLKASAWVENDCGLSNRPADLFIPILTMAKMVSEEQYTETLKWAKKFLKSRKGTYEDEWNQALVEICLRHVGEDISQKTIRDEWVELLHERDLLSGKEPRSCTKRLEGLSLARTDKITNRQIHFFIDREIIFAWGRRYSLINDNNSQKLIFEAKTDPSETSVSAEGNGQNEFNEFNEFSRGHPELTIWLHDQPDGQFTMSMSDYNKFGAEALKRGLIEKVTASNYRRTHK